MYKLMAQLYLRDAGHQGGRSSPQEGCKSQFVFCYFYLFFLPEENSTGSGKHNEVLLFIQSMPTLRKQMDYIGKNE